MAENFLSQEEVDALLKGVNGDQDDVGAAVDTSGVRPYNLATQERIVRGRMPTLEIINERFARLLRIGLFNFLHRTAFTTVNNPLKNTHVLTETRPYEVAFSITTEPVHVVDARKFVARSFSFRCNFFTKL